MEQLL